MLTPRLRYTGLGLLLLVVVGGLLTAWLQLSHMFFTLIAIILGTIVALFAYFWDGWNQTTSESLTSRGIYPESVRELSITEPGLRRDWGGLMPSSARWRTPGTRAKRPAAPSGTRARRAAVSAAPLVRLPAASSALRPRPDRSRPTRRRSEVIAPDATITLAAEWQAAGIDDLFAALDSQLIGLGPVKQKAKQIGSLLLVDRARQRFDLTASRPSLHMCFTGAPGTGKTTVALMMADLLFRLGYLEKAHVVHAMRDDLVGEYIGQTAPKTQAVLSRAMGGVLFIDEAYYLYRPENERDYGQEAIEILLQVMENQRDDLVVILAGYKERMESFFRSNPGLSSRIAHHLDFPDYSPEELLEIALRMVQHMQYTLSESALGALREYIPKRMNQPHFANARSIRNALDRARLRHANRLCALKGRELTRDDLMTIEGADLRASRVFQ
jgi:probable Rubsico expression protein CbbX